MITLPEKEKSSQTGWLFSFLWLAKQALIFLPGYETGERSSLGKRPDRRQWRKQGGERVAAVGEGRRRSAEDIRRAPQQARFEPPAPAIKATSPMYPSRRASPQEKCKVSDGKRTTGEGDSIRGMRQKTLFVESVCAESSFGRRRGPGNLRNVPRGLFAYFLVREKVCKNILIQKTSLIRGRFLLRLFAGVACGVGAVAG